MRIGLYQFPGSGDMGKNYETIEKAVSQAASQRSVSWLSMNARLQGIPAGGSVCIRGGLCSGGEI